MTLPGCCLALMSPEFACLISLYIRLEKAWSVIRAGTITGSFLLPIALIECVSILIAVYCRRFTAERFMPIWPRGYFQASSAENVPALDERVDAFHHAKPFSSPAQSAPAARLRIAGLDTSQVEPVGVERLGYPALKRMFDLMVSLVGLVILSPLIVPIAVLVKLSSPGPIFFYQDRVGRHGRVFTMVKFRTMFCSSKHESDTLWTTSTDPRVTPLGSILRKFNLDELPQLFNVLRGDMSLVGPRPERPYFVEKFSESFREYHVRHCCQVGITGWAQVNGLRGDTSISERLQYDLQYIRNWSFSLDLWILARTAVVALTGDQNGC